MSVTAQPRTSAPVRRKVPHYVVSFLFGALGFATFTAIPYLFGPDISTYFPPAIASAVMFVLFVIFALVFLHLSGVELEGFLVLSTIGGFLAFVSFIDYFDSSPTLPILFLGYFGTLVAGAVVYLGFSRSRSVKVLLTRFH